MIGARTTSDKLNAIQQDRISSTRRQQHFIRTISAGYLLDVVTRHRQMIRTKTTSNYLYTRDQNLIC